MASGMEKVNGMRNVSDHHVMMLPSLGHGHLIPFMHLAKKLATRGFTVTFVITFHHKSSLQKKVEAAPGTRLNMHLVEMEVPRDDLVIGKVNSNSMSACMAPSNASWSDLYAKKKEIPSQLRLGASLLS